MNAIILFLLLAPHVPPAMQYHLHVLEDRAELEVLLWTSLYEQWTNSSAVADGALDEAAWAEQRAAAFSRSLTAFLSVEVDDLAVFPIPLRMRYVPGNQQSDYVPYALVTLAIETKGKPRRIAMRQLEFLPLYDLGSSSVPFLHDEGPDSELGWTSLTEEEPSFIWHARAPVLSSRQSWTMPAARQWVLPLASFAILALAFGALFWTGKSLRTGLLTFVVGSVAAVLAAPWATLTVRDPFAAKAPPLEPKAAQELFTSLHTNIYRAFDHDEESAIYDTLAQSVGDELLEVIYARVYEQLILRDEGGARSKVRHVALQDVSLDWDPERPQRFSVEAQWRVQGEVSHDGHTHTRTLNCSARYLVGHGEDGWKIREEEVLGTEREQEDIPSFEGAVLEGPR